MGKKVNIWLDDKSLELWGKIPSGERSNLIKDAIKKTVNETKEDKKERLLRMKISEYEEHSRALDEIEDKRDKLLTEINNLRDQSSLIEIDKDYFWGTISDIAGQYICGDIRYNSYSFKSKYSIARAELGKIYIHNLRTGRENSNFSKKTVELAIDRLIANGGKIPIGDFIPVKMHEYTVVALHPRLYERNGYIYWISQDIVKIEDDWIPEHQGEMPPSEWRTTENFLAVLIDGRKALIGQGRKIVIFFLEPHNKMAKGITEQIESPWQTKHWKFILPGLMHWGHDYNFQKVIGFTNVSPIIRD
jgi:hypothetical protein